MRRAVAALLLAPLMFGCAQQAEPPAMAAIEEPPQYAKPPDVEMPPGVPSPEALAVVARLPLRIGPWVRAVGPPDEGAIARNGLLAPFFRYTISGAGAWATVAVNDHATALPDGLDSPAIAEGFAASKQVVRANAPGNVARMRMVWLPDAPPQRCVTGRAVAADDARLHVACSTAVAGRELRVRITAAYRRGDSGRLYILEGEMARLIADVTRAAAGRFSEPGMRPDGLVFIPVFGPENPL